MFTSVTCKQSYKLQGHTIATSLTEWPNMFGDLFFIALKIKFLDYMTTFKENCFNIALLQCIHSKLKADNIASGISTALQAEFKGVITD